MRNNFWAPTSDNHPQPPNKNTKTSLLVEKYSLISNKKLRQQIDKVTLKSCVLFFSNMKFKTFKTSIYKVETTTQF